MKTLKRLLLVFVHCDDNKGDDDAPSDSENGNGNPYRSGRPRGTQDPLESHRPRALVALHPILMSNALSFLQSLMKMQTPTPMQQ